ncbi:hypothetical protein EDC35_106140 [Thiobaca trueperi]|uniref:Nucleotidyltransferase-like protein n=1 Tax=Thiobaca trueperi TaxID=127458 RepID=A0A4R3MZM8_9GAMM|nr:hypothetical protein EDC35_106140 [Thiobaca trueperi]
MRITPAQSKIIHETVAAMFGPGACVRLFGSRLDEAARGGDIDLFVETNQRIANRAAMASRLAAQLQITLGDQRIDVILVDPETRPQPIHAQVRHHGVPL